MSITTTEGKVHIEHESTSNWIQVYKNYLIHGIQPENNNEVRMLRMKSSRFTIIDHVLFKIFVTGLLQRYLEKDEADTVLRDVHEGECRNHTARRNLSLKVKGVSLGLLLAYPTTGCHRLC